MGLKTFVVRSNGLLQLCNVSAY